MVNHDVEVCAILTRPKRESIVGFTTAMNLDRLREREFFSRAFETFGISAVNLERDARNSVTDRASFSMNRKLGQCYCLLATGNGTSDKGGESGEDCSAHLGGLLRKIEGLLILLLGCAIENDFLTIETVGIIAVYIGHKKMLAHGRRGFSYN
jgi:hypothetical protein